MMIVVWLILVPNVPENRVLMSLGHCDISRVVFSELAHMIMWFSFKLAFI